MSSWSRVFTEIGKLATVFAYNRPGYGKSDVASTPRDGAHIAEELRNYLRSKGLQPPYILVGHSLGGLYTQLFARKYPSEVAGLVLVDSTCPTAADEQNRLWVRIMGRIMTPLHSLRYSFSSSQKEEAARIEETKRQVLRLQTFSGKPVIVLSADYGSESEIAKLQMARQGDLHHLYPGSRQILVKSGHFIQVDRPEVVIQSIQDILMKKENGGATPNVPF